ncbi:MAG: response regulator [Candidatus Rokubacteria bacterium]|nr:response regulator [Candidatus Rokubacteria bacterium]
MPGNGPDPRVLVVDDEEGPREAIRMILKPRYQVYTAGSGEEVLASLAQVRPDIIFMDVKMPRMDGVQLLERVKMADPMVEVVMITAYASLDTVQRAMRFGAMDYLVKPFAPKELEEAAARALARRLKRAEAPAGALAQLIGQMRDLARRSDPVEGAADLPGLLRAMLREVQNATGAVAASFFGAEPSAIVHSDLPDDAADAVATAWKEPLGELRHPVWLLPGSAARLPWPAGAALERLTVRGILVVPVADEGRPRVAGHLALYLLRPNGGTPPDLALLRPVMDLMVTAIRTSVLLSAAARQAAEQSLRAVQREILRQISTAVLEDPALDRTLAAITEQLQQGAGYERVQVLLEPTESPEPDRPGRAVFPLVAQGRRLGHLVVEAGRGARDLDRSERELLRMFSESVALVVRNANLHRELSEANTFLGNLIQSAADAIIALDPEGRVVTWNPSAERIFGRATEHVRGKPLADALPAPVVAQLEAGLTNPRASRTLRIRTEAGEHAGLELTVTCSPLRWGGRGETGLLLMAKDLTEQRRWEEQMARSEKLAALGQLAMGMAHDFNNLLQVILGHTQLIASDPVPDRVTKGIGTIEQVVRDGVETVARIKRYARRETDFRPERVDLPEVVREVIEITRPRLAHGGQHGSRIVVRHDLQPVPPVRARGAELREVLINLVLNAADALPQGGAIRLETRRDGAWALLSVSDTGIGIPPELRRRIFEPFFTTKEAGTGLGLSIVSGIISSYGGTIDVKSEPGQGATFTIRLPGIPEA